MKRFAKNWLIAQSLFMSMALLVFIGSKVLDWALGHPWGGAFIVFALISAFYAAIEAMDIKEGDYV